MMSLPKTTPGEIPSPAPAPKPTSKSEATLYESDYKARYVNWRAVLEKADEAPTTEQWRILDRVHRRCITEFTEEACDSINQSGCEEPLLELIHGLAGSGKSKVIQWLC